MGLVSARHGFFDLEGVIGFSFFRFNRQECDLLAVSLYSTKSQIDHLARKLVEIHQ